MDVLDITIIKLLLANSRQPYRGLAEQVCLSVNAVHKRIQTLCDQGTIRAFTTKISLQAQNSPIINDTIRYGENPTRL